ncbi:leucine-rich repeat domain-containing protein, partial [Bacillus sp. JJ1521]|uniref:leucine-rich repeat domain-containing protein n=1 Tax=Bacillus sp. JJ1521 TaxID=3122957 RepID=UPI002FFEB584
KWIKISELYKIKELDLSNKGISNLDGLEYFLNLERLNLSNNSISDFRLLMKLPKLKQVNIEGNPLEESEKTRGSSTMVNLKNRCLVLGLKITTFLGTIHLLEV